MFFKLKMEPNDVPGSPIYEYLIVEGVDWVDAEENAEGLPFIFGTPKQQVGGQEIEVKNPLEEKWPILTAAFFEETV